MIQVLENFRPGKDGTDRMHVRYRGVVGSALKEGEERGKEEGKADMTRLPPPPTPYSVPSPLLSIDPKLLRSISFLDWCLSKDILFALGYINMAGSTKAFLDALKMKGYRVHKKMSKYEMTIGILP